MCLTPSPVLYMLGEVKRMNLFQALTDAMDIVLESDESAGTLYTLIQMKL